MVIQNVLANYGIYLSDNSTLSDKKLNLTLFFVESNKNTSQLWHNNNTFPETLFKQDRTMRSLLCDFKACRKAYYIFEDEMYFYSGVEVFKKIDKLLSFKISKIESSKPVIDMNQSSINSDSVEDNYINLNQQIPNLEKNKN